MHHQSLRIRSAALEGLRAIGLMILLLLPLHRPAMAAPGAASIPNAPLPAEDVVNNLVQRNQQRAQNLLRSQATRVYHLAYHGFPGDREAEMTVEASYDQPSTKHFKVVSQSGSKVILDRVFTKLLEGEREAARPEVNARTQLNRENYDFALTGYDEAANEYVLEVTPKSKSKYVYHGTIWVDGTDFAVKRIEAEPAQNPSFWTKKSEISQEYVKVQNFWLPARNQSTSYIRLGGRAVLTIEYKDYQLNGEAKDPALISETEAHAAQ